jgi:UDP-3-O-acyl-N-acetylglucosamine deacetylase
MTAALCSGLGLFTGIASTITFRHGQRIHIERAGTLTPATIDHLASDPTLPNVPRGFPVRNTTLRLADGHPAATIEHVMSALAGMGIWNATIALDGPELPIGDGSAIAFTPFLAAMELANIEPIRLTEPIEVREGSSSIVATPRSGRGTRLVYQLDYGPNSVIKAHEAAWEGDRDEYLVEIAPARTFSLAHEVEFARRAGLFASFSPRELLVVGADGKLIENEWRFPDEPARHKLLDLIGDLALLGAPLEADVVATRSGHALTHRFCREVLATTSG